MIDGFSISGYRSLGPEEVKIVDLGLFNVFIGKNNCGKSNVLRSLHRAASALGQPVVPAPYALEPSIDFCQGDVRQAISFGIQVKKEGLTSASYDRVRQYFAKVAGFAERLPEDFWCQYMLTEKGQATPTPSDLMSVLMDRFGELAIVQLFRANNINTDTLQQGQHAAVVARVLQEVSRVSLEVHFIDAFRRISEDGGNKLAGSGLVRALRNLQSPEHTVHKESKEKFQKIGDFVRSVLGEPKARLEIPAEKDDIYVVINDRTLPLDSLGTGIHELVIMAAGVTVIDKAIVCIEEPEIHFHPELQKKFARYLQDHTGNQYLIATHSNAFLDLPDANTYRCWLDYSKHTKCELASKASDKHAILVDLGYRPSDLLQANYVIWVEGPSDRIYINWWLKAKAPDLVEGLHYAIMFYGGRLLSHLSYDGAASQDEAVVSDFIHLARLNRTACVVIDSDRQTPDDALNQTKRRIQEEFEKESCFVWVTDGRMIENYLTGSLLSEAIAEAHPNAAKGVVWKQYGALTKLDGKRTFDKVAVARSIAGRPADFTMLDLNEKVNHLIECIRQHNSE